MKRKITEMDAEKAMEDTNRQYEDQNRISYDQELMSKDQRKRQYYVNGEQLKAQIRKYQETNVISNRLGQMIMKICTRFSMHPRFFGYSYRQDFVNDAILRCITHAIGNIDLDKPNCNPFSYLTQTAYNCFRQKIKSQKKYQKYKQGLRDSYYNEMERQYGLQHTKTNDQNGWNGDGSDQQESQDQD